MAAGGRAGIDGGQRESTMTWVAADAARARDDDRRSHELDGDRSHELGERNETSGGMIHWNGKNGERSTEPDGMGKHEQEKTTPGTSPSTPLLLLPAGDDLPDEAGKLDLLEDAGDPVNNLMEKNGILQCKIY
ncbi:hypothetical protein E2562_006435 [Oryza meyeriana var. granulata]|uniref:Uncharacterized protein n=1 Tax=Oryza meyeriana var. granulata TaxID=110450 RepID=A0A6G1CP11_9ORYZ|nr:hypothetical protein E2562_006435 [Oryza meyeriana var. granulata]